MESPSTHKKQTADKTWPSRPTSTEVEQELQRAEARAAAAIKQAKHRAMLLRRNPDKDTNVYPEDNDVECAFLLNVVVRVAGDRLDERQQQVVANRVFGYLKLEDRHDWWEHLGDPQPEDAPHLYELVGDEVRRLTGEEPEYEEHIVDEEQLGDKGQPKENGQLGNDVA